LKYTIPGIPLLLAILLRVGEQWFSQSYSKVLTEAPWGWIFAVSAAFLIGALYADLFNKDSGIRIWIKSQLKCYEVEHFVLAHNSVEGKAWYEAIISIRFTRPVKALDCSLEVTQYLGSPHAETSFVILMEKLGAVEANLLKKFSVATFPIRISKEVSPGYPYWGKDQNKKWAGDGDHLIKFRVKKGFISQSSNFLITAIKKVSAEPEPVLLFGGPNNQNYVNI